MSVIQQVRVEEELRREFRSVCQRAGFTSSQILRAFMERAVEKGPGALAAMVSGK